MEIDWMACGKRIQTLRDSLKLTQEELAEIVGVSSKSMSPVSYTHLDVYKRQAR